MARQETGNAVAKRGRKLIHIDKDQFEKLCGIQAPLWEIAGWFKCSPDTIERWCKRTYGEIFADTYKKNSAQGKIGMRRKMYQMAIEGDRVMLIWLSKQYLGMSEKFDQKVEQNVEAEVTYRAEWGSQVETTPTTPEAD